MKAVWAAWMALGLLNACAAQSPDAAPLAQAGDPASLRPGEAEAVALLRWLDTADPVADSKRAVAQGRPGLFMGSGRGAPPPGIPAERQSAASKKCPLRMLPGATDTVRGNVHLRYLQRAHEYAERYNRSMLAFCSP